MLIVAVLIKHVGENENCFDGWWFWNISSKNNFEKNISKNKIKKLYKKYLVKFIQWSIEIFSAYSLGMSL